MVSFIMFLSWIAIWLFIEVKAVGIRSKVCNDSAKSRMKYGEFLSGFEVKSSEISSEILSIEELCSTMKTLPVIFI